MAKAVEVGGVFPKARDPQAPAARYGAHLGIQPQGGGRPAFDGPESAGMAVFDHFLLETSYFEDGGQEAMANFRVDDLDPLPAH